MPAATVHAAQLKVSPAAGPAGSEVTVTARGLSSGPVDVRWDDDDGPLLATVEGPQFTVVVRVPDDAAPGSHSIVVVALGSDRGVGMATTFEVTA